MNLNFLITKKHLFKHRKISKTLFNNPVRVRGGIYSLNQFRFELVYLRTLKKIFRKKYYKKLIYYFTSKYWIMIRPNFLLTMKSKNSRMGSGVGLYVRVTSLIKPNRPIILLKNYHFGFTRTVIKFIKTRWNIDLYINHLLKNK